MKKHNSAKYFTRGGQITFHNWRMLFQINKAVSKVYLVCLSLLTILTTYIIAPKEKLVALYYWCYAQLSPLLSLLGYKAHVFTVPYNGKIYYETPKSFLAQWQFVANAKSITHYLIIGLLIAFFISIIISFFVVKWLTNAGKKQTENQFVRGTQLENVTTVVKSIKKNQEDSDLVINGLPLLLNSETQHLLQHGTTGTGKSQLIMKLLDCLRARGDKVILYDKGCTYTPIYFREGKDVILNPFDERCANWDLWKEALEAPDFENMAESLIPMHGETEPFWVNAARTIFSSVAFTMQDDDDRSIGKLLKVLLRSELPDLAKYIENTEAATLSSDKIEKTAIGIRAVITTYLKALRFQMGLNTSDRNPFAIRDWVQNEQDNGWLFISSNTEQHAALRPLISMWIAMASISLLSLPENRDRRIWFVVDELPSLHKLPQLPETIAEVRKFGGCFVLGMQSYAQLEKVYGRNAAREVFDLLNTRFFFRSPSAEMAKLVASELGEQEVEDMRENYSYGANRIRDGISIGSQRTTRPIVVYPEIMSLADMTCYTRLPGDYPITVMHLKYKERKKIAAGFIKRHFKKDQVIEESINHISAYERRTFAALKLNTASVETNVTTSNVNTTNNQSRPVKKTKGLGQDNLLIDI